MSADYWNSTQRKEWQLTAEGVAQKRRGLEALELDLAKTNQIPAQIRSLDIELPLLKIYLHSCIHKLGRKLEVRSVPMATAEIYLSRFLLSVSYKEINLYLLVATCLYLACKIEESPVHIRNVCNEARVLWPEYVPHDFTKLAEFEFYLIEELNNCLIVHNPYRCLMQIYKVMAMTNLAKLTVPNGASTSMLSGSAQKSSTLPLQLSSHLHSSPALQKSMLPSMSQISSKPAQTPTDGSNCLILSDSELQVAWSVLNDGYATDSPLIYPPHILALAAIYLSVVMHETGNAIEQSSRLDLLTTFLGVSNVDLDEVIAVVQTYMTLYENWEGYEESKVRKLVAKLFQR